MKFERVSLVSIGHLTPAREITSDGIEGELKSVYDRLRLPTGRLEGMSGIRARRLWNPGTRLSDCSAESCALALRAAGIQPHEIGCLIHASVCREYLEPATACRVHHLAALPEHCWVYDLSNACLGVMNGAVQVAQMIESGAIHAGIVVGTEDASGLVSATLSHLQNDASLTRQSIKPAFASLTIGSGSCAWLLADTDWLRSRGQLGTVRVKGAVAIARTEFHELCQSDTDQAGAAMQPTMSTDSEQLLEAGLKTGLQTFERLLAELAWSRDELVATVCHQVGGSHRRRMLETLCLSADRDFATFEDFGNTGSVALPTALARAAQAGFLPHAGRCALLGIGSGVNSLMIGLELGTLHVASTTQRP